METFSELEQHFIQLDADLVNATKVIGPIIQVI